MQPMYWYLCVISAIAVILAVCDKIAAKCRARRVPELTLFVVSLLGGSAAMYLAMLFIRHKTKHKRFMLGLPAIILAQVALYCLFI
ncbi:MAG: DUF1294 domain-containing protein [Clostridia bacterium]|nr:DUF1294 domain-containing protein [Clostridia bacterium]